MVRPTSMPARFVDLDRQTPPPPDHDSICTFRTANKHAAVSYARAGEMIAQLELEVQELVA